MLYVTATMDLTAAACALLVLKPMLARHHARNAELARNAEQGEATRTVPVGVQAAGTANG